MFISGLRTHEKGYEHHGTLSHQVVNEPTKVFHLTCFTYNLRFKQQIDRLVQQALEPVCYKIIDIKYFPEGEVRVTLTCVLIPHDSLVNIRYPHLSYEICLSREGRPASRRDPRVLI